MLVTYFVSDFQPIDFMRKRVCSVQYTIFYLYVFHQCLKNSLTHFGYKLTVCLEIWKRYCIRVYESPVAKNRDVTADLSWNGIAAPNLVSLVTIFGPTKLIISSKSAGAIRVSFLYCPLNSWHFKSASKLVQYLCTQTSFCRTPFANSDFLVVFFFWTTSSHQEQRKLVDHSERRLVLT